MLWGSSLSPARLIRYRVGRFHAAASTSTRIPLSRRDARWRCTVRSGIEVFADMVATLG